MRSERLDLKILIVKRVMFDKEQDRIWRMARKELTEIRYGSSL